MIGDYHESGRMKEDAIVRSSSPRLVCLDHILYQPIHHLIGGLVVESGHLLTYLSCNLLRSAITDAPRGLVVTCFAVWMMETTEKDMFG